MLKKQFKLILNLQSKAHYLTSVQGSSTILQRWGWRFRTLWVSFTEPCWKKKKKQGMQMLLTEVQVRQYWRFSWRFSTPAILFALLVFSWWQNLFLILVYIWPGLGLLVGFLLSSTRSEFGHISYQGQPYPTWVQVLKSILHTHQEEIILNQISTLCYRVICLNPGDGISDHWLHSGGSAHFWSHRGDWKNQD